MTIVTSTYRYKRPPRKQQAAPLVGPAVVTKRARKPKVAPATVTAPPANDDGKLAPKKPAIVTVRRPGQRDAPDLTPGEHKRRGDAAAALFREIQRRIAKEAP